MIKVAIIGTGAISAAHVNAYLAFPERCEITAVCDMYPQKAQALIDRYQLNAAIYEDYQALLHEDVDLVSVCTPPYTHADLTVDFLTAGKHVIVEKPMAPSLSECDRMIEAQAASGKLLSVVAQNRFRTPMMKLKQTLDSGMAGRILHAQVDSHWWRGHCYYDLWWRGTWEKEGGGCTINHAVHHIDALLWMMGKPQEVHAFMSNTAHDNAEVEDLSVTMLRYAGGALGQITSSVVHHGEEQQLIFQGSDARISVPWKVTASITKNNGFPEPNPVLAQKIRDYYDQLPEVAYEAHAGQIDDVLKAVEQGTPLLIGGMSGRDTVELITAIYKSASTGETVSLPLTKADPFYTREGIMQHATHFYEKKHSVENFAATAEITTGSNYNGQL